jgi:histidine triad (HIT) family protein
MLFCKKVAKKIKKAITCYKIGVVVCGIEVPHVHVHLIPIDSVADIDFSKAKQTEPDTLAKTANKISNN